MTFVLGRIDLRLNAELQAKGGGMSVRRGIVKTVVGVVVLALCGIAVLTMGLPKGLASSSSMATLPPPGTYNIDPVHSFAYFGAWHHIVGLVRGRFNKVTGTITAAKDPADCAVDISIDTAKYRYPVRQAR